MIEIVLFLFVLISLSGILWAISSERGHWNNGRCAICNKKWKLFDVDSQGGRGYIDGKHTIWISYPLIDKNRA